MTRQQNLFLLAHLCHVTPDETFGLRLGDFVSLLSGIRQYEAASKPEGSSR